MDTTGRVESRRETLIRLFDAARVNGVAYLFVICTLGQATIAELSDVCGDERHTIGRHLRRLESRGFAICVQDGHAERWHPTPIVMQLFRERLLVENVPTLPSSSDLIRSEGPDLIRPESEEEEANRKKMLQYLLSHHGVTGLKARELLGDAWVTPLRLTAWMIQVNEMKREGFQFHKSPEAYAISCLLRHDEPPRSAYNFAGRVLEINLQGCFEVEEDEEDESES